MSFTTTFDVFRRNTTPGPVLPVDPFVGSPATRRDAIKAALRKSVLPPTQAKALARQNERLRRELEQRDREFTTLSREVRLAREIQGRLLPLEPPRIEGYDMAGMTQPARSVGGDFFDFMPLSDGSVAIWLGDVVGKGLPAAMLMASLQATLRFQTSTEAPAGECLRRANHELCHSTAAESFATLFYAVLDTHDHVLRYINAGHNAPFLLRARGGCRRLSKGAMVMGFFEDWDTELGEITVEPQDLLVIFSDGISEATNARDEQLGDAGLDAIVRQLNGDASSQVLETIMRDVEGHAGDAPQHDDMTLVAVRRTAG